MNIGRFSVKNSVLINIVSVALLILGTVSYIDLPRELNSDISFSWVFIAIPYPGASAEEIEKSITIKVEEELDDLDKLKRISSTSTEGSAFIQVEFESDVSDEEFKRLYQDTRTEFDKVELPDGALTPWIDDFSSSDFMSLITVYLEGDVNDSIINLEADHLQERLLDIDGISKADIVGGKDREIWIEADPERLEAYGLSLQDVADAVKYSNMNVPAGKIDDKTRSYILQTIGELNNPQDFKKVIVRRRAGKGSLKVGDVASVNNGFAESAYDVRFNGTKALSLEISKKKNSNSIEIVDRIKETVKEYEKQKHSEITVSLFNDTTVMIRDILYKLQSNALFGFILLLIVLFIFLGIRNSVLTALAIPITFSITFLIMRQMGESLNGNSLFALVLVLGMIVDHAIVLIENAYRYRQEGLDPETATIKGTNEVVKPLISATATTAAAFLPLMLVPGTLGKFMRIIPLIVTIVLIASTLEALIILPSHFADFGSRIRKKGEGFIGRWKGYFRNIATKVYNHRYLTLLIAVASVLVTIFLLPFVKQDLFSGEDFTMLYVDIEMPMGTAREETNRVASKFEERLLELKGNGELVSVGTTVGFLKEPDDWITQSNVAQITLDIEERDNGRQRSLSEIRESIKDSISGIPGAEAVNIRMIQSGPPTDKPIEFRIAGDDLSELSAIAEGYKKMLRKHPFIYNIDDNYKGGATEYSIEVKDERAAEFGLSSAQIGSYIRGCFSGITSTTFYDKDEELDVIVKFKKEYTNDIEKISSLKIPAPSSRGSFSKSRMIPLSSVCTFKRTESISEINRKAGNREITVFAETKEKEKIQEINEKIEREFDRKYSRLYPGISLKMGGEFAEWDNLLADIIPLFLIGIFLIYIILGTQFKSYLQPIIIGFTVFFAFVGCLLFLVISQTPFSIVVLYAGIALTGICVNDAIVLISFINNRRKAGYSVKEAIIEGSTLRFRPIILTSVTTIGGLLPMALGIGGKSPTWAPMASTIIFGLLFSTAGTLLVIPSLYAILNDVMERFGIEMKLEE